MANSWLGSSSKRRRGAACVGHSLRPTHAITNQSISAIRDLKMAKNGSKKCKKDKNNKKGVFALFAFFASAFSASNPEGLMPQHKSPSQISGAGYVESAACAECHREIAE